MLKNDSNDDDVKEFEPDDEKYLAWINEHPEGFILTTPKSLYPPHTVIHRASCDKIKTLKGSANRVDSRREAILKSMQQV